MAAKRSKSMQPLQQTLHKLKMTLSSLSDAILWVTQDGTIEYSNPAFDRLHRFDRPIQGALLQQVLPLHRHHQPVPASAYPHVLLQSGTYMPTCYEVIQPDRTLAIEISGSYSDQDGPPLTMLVLRDLTAVKQAEAQRRQIEQEQATWLSLLRATLECTADGVLVVLRDRSTPIYNQKFLQMWSMPEELLRPDRGDERLAFLSQQTIDPKGFIDRIWELFLHRPEEETLELIELKDGRIFERYSQPQRQGNQIVGRVWSFRDVTQRRRAEAALEQSEAELRTLFGAMDDVILVFDRHGRCLKAAPTKTNRFFKPPSENINKTVHEVLPQAVADLQLKTIQQALDTRQTQAVEYSLPFNDGEHWFYANAAPLSRNTVVWLARDITELRREETERKRTEAALRRSELKYRNLFENSQVGIFRTRVEDGLIIDANQRSAEQAGYSSVAELIGKASIADFYANPADRDWVLERVRQYGECSNYEVQFRHCDGSVRWALCSVRLNAEEGYLDVVATDIDDRKRAQEGLQRQLAAIEAASDGIAILGIEGKYIYMNSAHARIYGYDSAAELVGKSWEVLYDENELMRLSQSVMPRFFRDGQWRGEASGKRKDGSTYPQEISLTLTSSGEFVCIVQDITERKRLEQELRQSRSFLDTIINSIPIALFAKDLRNDFRYVLINKTAENLIGATRQEAMGYNDYELVERERADQHRREDEAALAHGDLLELPDTWLEVAPRQRRLLHGWKRPIFDERGEATHLLGIIEDVTDRWHRDQALRLIVEGTAAETGDDFFRACVRYLAEVLGVRYTLVSEFANDRKDRVRTLAFWNGEGFSENFEYDLKNTPCDQVFAGQTCYYPSNLQNLFPNDPDLITLQVESYLGILLSNASGETLGHLAVLDTRPMQYDPGRELILRIFAARAGAELSRKQSELALRVAKEAAEAANRAKSTFLANMSHELRTPLNSILGFTQLMERDPALTGKQQGYLTTINRSGEHLLSLINDVLEMSKIEAGRITFNPEPFDLSKLLQTLEEMFRVRTETKRLTLQFDLAADLPHCVSTDEGKLRQVLMNLLSNAVKFTDVGGIVLRAKVLTSTAIDTYLLHFEVQDTGRGIASEEIEHLFQPFVQTSSSTQIREGTGLGLAISRQFVQLMGGEINVESEVGRGSTFSFQIMASPAEAIEPALPIPKQGRVLSLAPNQPLYRILIVDDRAENRDLITQLLSLVGFETRTAQNGQEAIEQWQSWQPHLVWMDMRMPVMDGYDATRSIRQMERAAQSKRKKSGNDRLAALNPPPCKIIALTASAFEEQRAIILSAGCDDLVRKPFREEIIFQKLQEHLGVEYLYESQSSSCVEAAQSPVLQPAQPLTPADLNVMSEGWIAALHQAALAVDSDYLLQLIEQIPELYESLIVGLKELVDRYDFDRILELVEQSIDA